MNAQLTLFDLIQTDIDPILEVAKMAGVYWTNSRQKLVDLHGTNPLLDEWTNAVQQEYCPYGCAGGWGRSRGPNTLNGWDMRSGKIETEHIDRNGKKVRSDYRWKDFAKAVAELIDRGEYK